MSQSTEGSALLEQRRSQHGDSNPESMNGIAEERRRLKGKGKEIVEELDASGNQGRDLDNNHNKRTQPRIEALRTTSRSKSKSKSRSKSNSRSKSPTKLASTSQKNSPSVSNFLDFTSEDESRIISHLSASRRDWHGSSICHELAALYPNHSYEAYRDFLKHNLDDGLCLVDEIGKSRSRDTTERAASTSISLDSIGNDGQISNQVSNENGNITPQKQVGENTSIFNSTLSSEKRRSLRNREEWAYDNKRKIRRSDEKVNRRGRTTREAAKGISYKEIPILSSSEADSDSQSEEEQEVIRKGPIKCKSISRRKSDSRVKVSRPSNSPREESKDRDDQVVASTSKLVISNDNDREWLEPEVEGLVFEMFRIRSFSPSEDLASHLSRDPGHRNQVEYLEFLKQNMNQGWNLTRRLESLKFLLSEEEVGMGVEKRDGNENENGNDNGAKEIPKSDNQKNQDTEAIIQPQTATSKVAINSSAPTSSVATPSKPKSSSVATPSKPKSLTVSTPLKVQSSSVATPSKPSSSVATPKKFSSSSVNTPSKSQPRPISSYFKQINTPPNNDRRKSTSNSASGARPKRLESQIRFQERTSGSFSPPSPRSLLFPDSYPPSSSKKRKQSEEVREGLLSRTPSSNDKFSSRPNKRPRQEKVIDLITPEPEANSGPIDLTTPEPGNPPLPGNLNSNQRDESAFVDMTLDEDSEDEQMDLDQDHDSTLRNGPASNSVPVVQSSGEIPPTSAAQPQQKADSLIVDQDVRLSPSQEQTELLKEAPSTQELIETIQVEADKEIPGEVIEGNEQEIQEETSEDLQEPDFGEEQVEHDLEGEMEQDPRLGDDLAEEESEKAETGKEEIQKEEARNQEAEAAESRDEENIDEEILEELETQEPRTEEEEIQEEEMQEEEKGGEEEIEEQAIERELSLDAEEETQEIGDEDSELEKEVENVYREESQSEELPQEEVQEAELEDELQEDDVHREDEQEDIRDPASQEQERQLQAEVLELFPNQDEELSSQVGESSESSPPPPYHLANAGSILSDGDLFSVSEEESMPAQGADLDDESESEGEEERRRAEQELDEEVAKLMGPESPYQRNSSSRENSRAPSPTLTSRQVPAQPASLVNGGFVPFKSVASSSSKATSRKQFNPWPKQSGSTSTSSAPIPRAIMTKGSRASTSRNLHSSPSNRTLKSVGSQADRSSSIVAFSDQSREKPSYLAYKEAMTNLMNEYGLDKLQMKELANLPENKGKIKLIKAGLENKILKIKKKWGLGRVKAIKVLKEENWVWEKVELRLEVENL